MPFDWMHPKVPTRFNKKMSGRFEDMHVVEIRHRARLLYNLHYTKKFAVKRISDNIRWEFELSLVPAFIKQVPKIVEGIYGRRHR